MHQVYDPAFADEVPYNIAVVELDEGVRMTTNVVGCANEELQIGMPLEVTFERVSEDVAIPRFRRCDRCWTRRARRSSLDWRRAACRRCTS